MFLKRGFQLRKGRKMTAHFSQTAIEETQTILSKFCPDAPTFFTDFKKSSTKVRRLKKGEVRNIDALPDRYAPCLIDSSNFYACTLCDPEAFIFISLKSFKHHFTKIHGQSYHPPTRKALDDYISLNQEGVKN